MTTELVRVFDERGVAIFFLDLRDDRGALIDSRFFPTEREAREFLAMGVER